MTSKFKVVSVLVAAVAMSALTTSSVSAGSAFTSSSYPMLPKASSSTADVLDAFGSTVKCTEHEFRFGKYNSTSSPGKHDLVAAPMTTLTVLPEYKTCTAFGLPATVNFTHCDVVFHILPGSTNIDTDLVCPFGVKGVDIQSTSKPTTKRQSAT